LLSFNCSASALRLAPAIVFALAPVAFGTAAAEPKATHTDPPPLVDDLLSSFREVAGMEAHFREEKRIELLRAPLISEGQIYFLAPDRLARHVTSPSPSVMVINGLTISFRDSSHRTESLSLDQNPVARLFVDSFLKILAGDSAALGRIYDMTLTAGSRGTWALRLTPKAPPLSQLVDEIDLRGRGALLDHFRIVEVGGDETLTTFTRVDTHRRFDAEEERRLFAARPP
jgi:outer membrane lipoprotein-sorting protein